jgi:hypothetical protein
VDAVVLELRSCCERLGGRGHRPYDSLRLLRAGPRSRARCILCHRPFKA